MTATVTLSAAASSRRNQPCSDNLRSASSRGPPAPARSTPRQRFVSHVLPWSTAPGTAGCSWLFMTPRPWLAGRLRLNDGRRRRGQHRGRGGHFLWRLMRHLSLPLASDVPALPCRVRAFPARPRLVARPGLQPRLSPGSAAAPRAAVPVAPVAVGAQEEHLPALRPATRHEPKGLPHGTRCTPSAGDTPRPGLRLTPSQACQRTRARRARWASQWMLGGPSSSWASLSTLMRSFPQPANRFLVSSPGPPPQTRSVTLLASNTAQCERRPRLR